MPEPQDLSPAQRRRAAERFAQHVNRTPEGATRHLPRNDPAVLHFTDHTGATLIENAGGRFRWDSMANRYVPDA